MSTFAQLAALPSPGTAILVEVSTDYFATVLSVSGVTQRWSTAAGRYNNPSNVLYGGGIASVGRHQRGLGVDGLPRSSTLSLVLDNTDGAFDWLTARSTVESTVMKCRFKVYVAVFDPTNPTDNQVEPIGVYVPLDMPERDESRVFLELADDFLGDAADLSLTPSLQSWLDHASTTSVNTPWAASSGVLGPGVEWAMDPKKPLPLAFGMGRVPLLQAVRGPLSALPFVVCCTTDTTPTASSPDSGLFGVECANFGRDGRPAVLPSSVNALGVSASGIYYWDRSPFSITRDGRTWRIWLVQFDFGGMTSSSWVMDTALGGEFGAAGVSAASIDKKAFFDAFTSKVGQMWCRAFPLSSHTYPAVPTGATLGQAFINNGVLAVDIARDILEQYCRGSVTIDTTSFDDIAAHAPNAKGYAYLGDIGSRAVKGLQPSVIAEAGQTRGVLQGLCNAGMFDLTTLGAGQVRAIASTATYEAYVGAAALSATRIDETRIVADSLRLRIPSQGQRHAPFNRVYLEIGNGSGALAPGRHGPFDHDGNLTTWGKPYVREIDATYADVSYTLGNVFDYVSDNNAFGIEDQFPVESIIRPVVSFRYGMEAMTLELGDYIILSLTRGGQTTLLDTYENVMWRVDGLDYLFESGQVEVTAVWAGDILDDIPFLLDDETGLVTRTTSGALGNISTTAASTSVTIGAGSFVAQGVTAGDILVLQDASEADVAFDRNRGIRITVVAATTLTLNESIAATATVTTWKILRGYTTYPTTGDTGYTDGGRMYGKAADIAGSGVFSDNADANKMKGG